MDNNDDNEYFFDVKIDKYSAIHDFFSDKVIIGEIEPIEVDVKKNNLVV